MAVIEFGSRAALEARIGADKVSQLFDFDGDGQITGSDETRLNEAIADANEVVTGLLLGKGFTLEQLATLTGDKQITRSWAGICAQLAGEGRTEWLDDEGHGPYHALGERGRSELRAMAKGELRSRLEAEPDGAGPNATLAGRVDSRRPPFIFNRNPGDRYGPGGF